MTASTFSIDLTGLDMSVPFQRHTTPAVVIEAEIVACDDEVSDAVFDCTFGCMTGPGRSRRLKRHAHGAGINGRGLYLGDRLSHCVDPVTPRPILLVPTSIPDGYVQDSDDPCPLFPVRLVELRDQLRHFEDELIDATAKVDALAATPWKSRSSGHAAKLNHALDDRLRLDQSVKSAQRVLGEFEREIGL